MKGRSGTFEKKTYNVILYFLFYNVNYVMHCL